ncbi:MAG: hypothetical protein DPW18_06305 [Chloroflexi bacterium]|nr:hypothetical protein [Chloroflexota bacterium]MDL1912459.1 hypothetical protein [Chloroflexi bacterium CFX6]
MNDKTIEWLLRSEAWIEYRTRLDLLEQPPDDPQVVAARKNMLADPKIKSLLAELTNWPGEVLNSHRSASQPFHKLSFIADLGLNAGDPPVKRIVDKVMKHQSKQGPFQLPTNVPAHFGGSGRDEWAWALCDAPVIVSSLIQMGKRDDPRVQTAVEHLNGLVRDNGWPCAVSPELGKFRGPGRKDDPCPYATLVMLKVLAHTPELREGKSAKTGVETLLSLWEKSREQHPYMFFMGTDFRKLKAPLFWYDILHVLDVLSYFKWAWKDKRFKEMLNLVTARADDDGRFTPESVWTAWKDWDFSQKKIPSPGLTLFVLRILKRGRQPL